VEKGRCLNAVLDMLQQQGLSARPARLRNIPKRVT
jgi:hypothetical protein